MRQIRQAVEQYLRVRRALGYKLLVEGRMLAQFATFLDERGQDHVTTDAAQQWATAPAGAATQWWAARLTVVRGFARFQAGFDKRTEIPPTGLLGRTGAQRSAPYLYSEREIAALLRAARRMRCPMRAATFESFVGLMASTGMRTGEAMGLDSDHVDLHGGMLTVHGTKFGKSRLIPLHASVVEQLDRYQHQRDLLHPRAASPAFFLSGAGTRLNHTNASKAFTKLLTAAGIRAEPKPRLYDLRHTFAVTALADWYEQNLDVAHLLPTLSTYLGHVSPATTYWYLHACPLLMTAAAQRLESSWRHAS
jgi:integrase/recombinase XerD